MSNSPDTRVLKFDTSASSKFSKPSKSSGVSPEELKKSYSDFCQEFKHVYKLIYKGTAPLPPVKEN